MNEAKERGITAERAYASNGRALGCSEEVDLLVNGCRVQAKRRKKIAKDFRVPDGADVVAFREDKGETFVLMRWNDFLDIVEEGW